MRGIKGLFGWRPRKPVELLLFTATGVWTKQADLVYIEVEVQGPGGNGFQDATPLAAGGGAGGYSRRVIRAADLGSQEIVTVGAVTSFGGWLSANAGSNATNVGNAPGGTAANGDQNVTGEVGPPVVGGGSVGGRSVMGAYGGGGSASGNVYAQNGQGGAVRIREVYVR